MSINTSNLFENADFTGKIYKPLECSPMKQQQEAQKTERVQAEKICFIVSVSLTLLGMCCLLYGFRNHRKIQILAGAASLGLLGGEIWLFKKILDDEKKYGKWQTYFEDPKEAEKVLSDAVKGVEQFISTGELMVAKEENKWQYQTLDKKITQKYQEEVVNVENGMEAVKVLQKWIRDAYLVSMTDKHKIEELRDSSCDTLDFSMFYYTLPIWAANHYLEKRYQDDPSYTLSIEEKRNLRLLAVACISFFFGNKGVSLPTHQFDQELDAHIKKKKQEFMKVAKKIGPHLFSVDILDNMEEEYKIPVHYWLQAQIQETVVIQGEEKTVWTNQGDKRLSVYECFEEGTPLPSQKDS